MAWCGCSGISQVIADESYCVGGTFFHEPVARVRHDGFAHVDGDLAEDDGLGSAEGFFSAYGENGHCELGAREDLVMLYVLGKGLELSEAGSHGAGFGVLCSIEFSRCFIGLAGAGTEVVPDAVEIDALAALHEAFFIDAPKGEVPEAVVFDDVVPWCDAGEGSVHDDEALD